jgi:hypothetical protein
MLTAANSVPSARKSREPIAREPQTGVAHERRGRGGRIDREQEWGAGAGPGVHSAGRRVDGERRHDADAERTHDGPGTGQAVDPEQPPAARVVP